MTTTGENPSRRKKNSASAFRIFLPVFLLLGVTLASLWVLKSQLVPIENDRHAKFAIKKGTILPDFTLHPFRGKPHKISTIEKKVFLVNFWASWCEACMVEIPSIVQLRNRFHELGLEIIFVNLDENPEAVMPPILEKMKISFPTYVDRENKLSSLFDVHGIPLTVILRKNREILYALSGEADWNTKVIHKKMETWLEIEPKS